MLWGLLIPWGWRAARGCQHPSYSPLNHMQTTTLRPQGKPLPLPRKAMPSARATSAHPNPPQSPIQQPTRILAPLWSCRLYRLSLSLEAVSRTWDTLYSVLAPKTDISTSTTHFSGQHLNLIISRTPFTSNPQSFHQCHHLICSA